MPHCVKKPSTARSPRGTRRGPWAAVALPAKAAASAAVVTRATAVARALTVPPRARLLRPPPRGGASHVDRHLLRARRANESTNRLAGQVHFGSRCRWSGERGGLAAQDVPGEPNVVLARARVADGEAQHVATVERRVREVGEPARVDALEHAPVVLVARLAAEADDRERARRGELPARLLAHPALEQR